MRNLFLFAAAALFAVATIQKADAAEPLTKGDAAPPFSLQGSDGKLHTLAEYAGKKVVVLSWFPKAFTSGCTAECKSLRENGKELRAFDIAYFAASVDPVDEITKFAKSLEVDYPILADPDAVAAKAYGVVSTLRPYPQRWTFYIGKDGKILFVDRDVKPGKAGADVAKKLAELGVAKKGS